MPPSIAEHFDALWVATTAIISFGLLLIIYFVRVWKTTVDEDIKKLKEQSSQDAVDLVKLYVSKNDCRIIEQSVRETVRDMRATIFSIEEKLDNLGGRVDTYHTQLMYELGIRNGKDRKRE
jgi:hypothetical protein